MKKCIVLLLTLLISILYSQNQISTVLKNGIIDPDPDEFIQSISFNSLFSDTLFVTNIGDSLLYYTASIEYDDIISDSTVASNDFESVLGWLSSGTILWSRAITYDGGSLNGTPMAVSTATAGGGTYNSYLNSGIIDLSGYEAGTISFLQKKTNGSTISTNLVEVSVDSVNWITVYSNQDAVGLWGDPDIQVVDIPKEYCSTTTMVRFHAIFPRLSGYWAIDDVVIKGVVPYTWLTLDGGATVSGTLDVSETDPITVVFNSAGLEDGTYTANIRLNSQFSNDSVPVRMDVATYTLLEAPVLISPSNGQNLYDLTPYFDWSTVIGASAYNIVVDNNSDFSSPEINVEVNVSNYQHTTNLATGKYYWKVRSKDEVGYSEFTNSWTVNLSLGIPIPLPLPPNTFDWQDIDGATSYNIYSSPDPYGTFTFLANVTESQFTYATSDPRMFFLITAVYDGKEQPETIEVSEKREK